MESLFRPRRFAIFLALCVAVSIAASISGCGGGVDSGGTGAPMASFASGPITGFGSVIVNGVHYDDRSAAVSDADGNVRSRDDLKLGMTTEIRGTAVLVAADATRSSTATDIVYGSAILGAVTSVDTAAGTLRVLGQTVVVTPTTVFDASLSGALAALSVGDPVEIYALADVSAGRYVATRIERRSGPLFYALRASVSNLNTQARTFQFGGLTVSYAGLQGSDLPATPANGQFLRLQLQTAPVAGVWQVARLRDGGRPLRDHEEARIEGLITAFTSSAQFSVDGVSVDGSLASFPDGTAGLGLGVRVRVEGSANGQVLVAGKVQIESEADVSAEGFELDGEISGIDVAARQFVIRGVTVDYSGSVDFRDGTAADLAAGRRVEVRGSVSSDGTHLKALRIRFKS